MDVDVAAQQQQQQPHAEDENAVETSDYDASFLPDDLFAEEEPLQAGVVVVADVHVVKMVSNPAAEDSYSTNTADEVHYESSVEEDSSESVSVADAAANSSAFALSRKEIEAGVTFEIDVCCAAPVAKGDSIDSCLTCSDCDSYCSWSSRDAEEWIGSSMPWEEEVEEEVPAAAAAAPSKKKKKKNIFKKAGKAAVKASKAAGRTLCRGMKAVLLPNPSLAYCLIGISPVME